MVLKKGTPKELTIEPYEVGLATTKAAKKTAAILLERTVSIFPMRNPLYRHWGRQLLTKFTLSLSLSLFLSHTHTHTKVQGGDVVEGSKGGGSDDWGITS